MTASRTSRSSTSATGSNGAPRMLIDPNTWSADGATALAEWDPSEDGRYLLYSVQDGGTDWRTVRVLDVATGQPTQDEVRWVKFSNLDWAKDGSGFYYSRFPEPRAGPAVPVDEREPGRLFPPPRHAAERGPAGLCDAGPAAAQPYRRGLRRRPLADRHSTEGTDARYEINLIDLAQPDAEPRRIVTGFENDWTYLGNRGADLLLADQQGRAAPAHRRHRHRPAGAELREIVPEDAATLDGASIVGRQLIAAYLVDAKSEVRTFALDGRRTGTVALPGIGSGRRLRRRPGEQRDLLCLRQLQPAGARSTATTARPARARSSPSPSSPSIPRDYEVRAGLLQFEGRHPRADVPGPPPRPRHQPAAADPALRLWRLQRSRAAALPAALDDLGRHGRRARGRQPARRRRIWPGLARCRPAREQAERVRRFHRRGRISDRASGVTDQRPAGDRGPLERRPAGRRGAQPAAGPVRGGAADGRA